MTMCIFFYSMTWLETFSAAEAWLEVKSKFLPSYSIAITFWPLIGVSWTHDQEVQESQSLVHFQTINFAFIPERNRVFFVSCFSILWTIYLAHIKNLERDKMVLEKKTHELEIQKASLT